jgi:flavin reductase (DIM6/NTAB) family NADH-FMN oxidoreductase RutF
MSPPTEADDGQMIDPALFRSVLGRFASGVSVVTARDRERTDHGMTVSAFCSLSLDPLLVLICVEHNTVLHGVIADATQFTVNILAAGQESISRRFSEQIDDRFEGIGYTRGVTGCAILGGVLGYLECDIDARYPGGDHTIIVGKVIAAAANKGSPLLYYRGGYAQLER